MKTYGIDLSSYADVRRQSVLIYRALHSRWMPLTTDPSQHWPGDALETFRGWVNAGWPVNATSAPDLADRIPLPEPRPAPALFRRDLRSLSQAELDHYRMCVDDAFAVGDASPTAPGQQFFSVHGDWCLHYQEAFLLWHRAYLLRFEQTIGCAVPYWNWYAFDASIDGSPNAGLPQAFKDLTYVHPRTGESRPNPLRFAAAWNGRSKHCASGAPSASGAAPSDCRYVQRDPVLYTAGDDQRPARAAKIALTRTYQDQVLRALKFPTFSAPQGFGLPWANIQVFNPPPKDTEYVFRDQNFDGAYEQPHDNYHGWVGPDMADNSYTAFDPVFWSYHANIDRIFEIWLRAHPEAAYTAGYPLHPFSGPRAERFEFTDPRQYAYTTIGDLARDSRGLGYDYGPPVSPDYRGALDEPATVADGDGCPVGHARLNVPVAAPLPERELLIRFAGVRCTLKSYAVDVFIGHTDPTPGDAFTDNARYVGRISRIGMGQEDDKGRCITTGVSRTLDATAVADRLNIAPGTAVPVSILVTELPSGREVLPEEYRTLPGFAPEALWFDQGVALRPTVPSDRATAARCCSGAPAAP